MADQGAVNAWPAKTRGLAPEQLGDGGTDLDAWCALTQGRQCRERVHPPTSLSRARAKPSAAARSILVSTSGSGAEPSIDRSDVHADQQIAHDHTWQWAITLRAITSRDRGRFGGTPTASPGTRQTELRLLPAPLAWCTTRSAMVDDRLLRCVHAPENDRPS